MSWQEARAVREAMTGTREWTVRDFLPPCVNANPEGFIDLEASSSDLGAARRLEAALRRREWTIVTSVSSKSLRSGVVLAAEAPDGRTHLILEVDQVLTVELFIDEFC